MIGSFDKIKLDDGQDVFLESTARTTRCKKCGNPIKFAVSQANRLLPIDSDSYSRQYRNHFNRCVRQEKAGLERRVNEIEENEAELNRL